MPKPAKRRASASHAAAGRRFSGRRGVERDAPDAIAHSQERGEYYLDEVDRRADFDLDHGLHQRNTITEKKMEEKKEEEEKEKKGEAGRAPETSSSSMHPTLGCTYPR